MLSKHIMETPRPHLYKSTQFALVKQDLHQVKVKQHKRVHGSSGPSLPFVLLEVANRAPVKVQKGSYLNCTGKEGRPRKRKRKRKRKIKRKGREELLLLAG
jgi:hypothetical protein